MAVLPTKIRLEIVTPERLLLSEEVDDVTLPGSEGYLGILPGHLPLLTMLGVGVLSYRQGGQKYHFAVSGGFAEVLGDRVIVLAETAGALEEIDAICACRWPAVRLSATASVSRGLRSMSFFKLAA